MRRTSRIIAAAEDAADMRRRMGAAALEMDAASDGSGQTRWRATVAARLPGQHWPERTMLITAVDAHTGEPVVFDRYSGVGLWTPSPPALQRLRCPSLQHRRQPVHRRRLPTIQRECRSGRRIRAGAGAVTTWRQNTGAAGLGMHLPPRSTNFAPSAAESKPSSRTATPATHSEQSDGCVDASARRSSRLRARQGPGRAAHRILALTPSKSAWTTLHARCPTGGFEALGAAGAGPPDRCLHRKATRRAGPRGPDLAAPPNDLAHRAGASSFGTRQVAGIWPYG